MNKKKKIQLAVDILLALLLIAVDQTTKYFAVSNLMNQKPRILWEGVFELHYLENRGAAFGMLQDQKMFLCSLQRLSLRSSCMS